MDSCRAANQIRLEPEPKIFAFVSMSNDTIRSLICASYHIICQTLMAAGSSLSWVSIDWFGSHELLLPVEPEGPISGPPLHSFYDRYNFNGECPQKHKLPVPSNLPSRRLPMTDTSLGLSLNSCRIAPPLKHSLHLCPSMSTMPASNRKKNHPHSSE